MCVGWHHWFNGHELGQTPGDGEGQGGLVCCSPWGRKELDSTEGVNWTEWPPSLSTLLQMSKIHSFCAWVIFHCMYIHHICIHSSVDGCLGCFHILPISRTAAVTIAVHVWFWISGYKNTQECDWWVVRYHCTFNSQNSIMGTLVQVNYFYNLFIF